MFRTKIAAEEKKHVLVVTTFDENFKAFRWFLNHDAEWKDQIKISSLLLENSPKPKQFSEKLNCADLVIVPPSVVPDPEQKILRHIRGLNQTSPVIICISPAEEERAKQICAHLPGSNGVSVYHPEPRTEASREELLNMIKTQLFAGNSIKI